MFDSFYWYLNSEKEKNQFQRRFFSKNFVSIKEMNLYTNLIWKRRISSIHNDGSPFMMGIIWNPQFIDGWIISVLWINFIAEQFTERKLCSLIDGAGEAEEVEEVKKVSLSQPN